MQLAITFACPTVCLNYVQNCSSYGTFEFFVLYLNRLSILASKTEKSDLQSGGETSADVWGGMLDNKKKERI